MTRSNSLGVSVSGLEELQRAFDDLGSVGQKSALQAALKKGAEIVAAEARLLAPRGTDIGPRLKGKPHLADSIIVRTTLSASQRRKRGGRRQEAEVFVGATVPHAHLVEFGHANVKTTGGHEWVTRGRGQRVRLKKVALKRVVGHVPPHPFMRPAFDLRRKEAAAATFQELGVAVQRVAKRYAGQAARGKLTRGARQAFRAELGL